jgi:hypothetical protein
LLTASVNRLRFSRALATVLTANIACLVVLNAAHAPTAAVLLLYPAALAGGVWILGRVRVRRPRVAAPPSLPVLALGFAALVLLPRTLYLFEWWPAGVVLSRFDDYARLSHLASMTLTGAYPLPHFANQDYLLSFYYCFLFPSAFLKFALPFLTLKDVLVVGNVLYAVLLSLSLAEFSTRVTRTRAQALLLLFLCTFFSGLDWLVSPRDWLGHAEIWQQDRFQVTRQISSPYTVFLWATHHVVGFYSIALAFLIQIAVRCRHRALKPLAIALILSSGFYSSVFAFAALIPVAWFWIPHLVKQAWRTHMWPVWIILAGVPSFLLMGRLDASTIWFSPARYGLFAHAALDTVTSFGVWMVAIPVIELWGLPLALLYFYPRFSQTERRLYAGSLAFYAAVFFIESAGTNNFGMRGLLLPVFVFSILFARHAALRFPFAVVLAIGTLAGFAHAAHQTVSASTFYWRDRTPPPHIAPYLNTTYRDLARDPSTRFYTPTSADRNSVHKYEPQRLVAGTPYTEMLPHERESVRRAPRWWLW